jgi:hypothetical protein
MVDEFSVTYSDKEVGRDSVEAVTATMKTSTDLKHAVDALHVRGFRKSDISVLVPVTNGRQDLSFEKSTKAYKGAVLGAIAGILVGVTLSALGLNKVLNFPTSLSSVSDQAPWIIVTSIVGIGILVGGTVGAFVGSDIPEYVTRLCERSIRGGTMIVAVHVDNHKWKRRAIDILKYYRAKDIVSGRKS